MSRKKNYFEPLTEAQRDLIYKEFNATEESLKNDVKILIEWLEKQPHLPNITDEEWLTNFLLRSKNSLERAKQLLDNYLTCRATMPDLFTDREHYIPLVIDVARKMTTLPLPKSTPDGVRLVSLNIHNNLTVSDVSTETILKGMQMIIEVVLKKDSTVQIVPIIDLNNLTIPLMASFFPMLKKFVFITTKMLPLRYPKIYILNLAPYAESFVQFCISLLSKKLAGRVEIWRKSPAELNTVFPPEILPKYYGGTFEDLPTFTDEWLNYIENECKDWLIADEYLKADLKKKPVDNINNLNNVGEYGVEGTFRKISLD